MTGFYESQVRMFVSVDCIVFGFDGGRLMVLIGHRRMDPGRGQWSLYGGFVRADECLDDAAKRVLHDLTGLDDPYMKQVGAFGNVDRDPGERVISVAYYSMINVGDYDESLLRQHGLQWVPIDSLPDMYSDHRAMIAAARRMMQRRFSHEPIGFNLLPDMFTLTNFQHLYEAVYGEEVDKRNFRKKVKEMSFIQNTGLIDKTASKRGAGLYTFNSREYDKNANFKL